MIGNYNTENVHRAHGMQQMLKIGVYFDTEYLGLEYTMDLSYKAYT